MAQTASNRHASGLGLSLVEQMVDRVPDTIFYVKDLEGRYVSGNTALARLVGLGHGHQLRGRAPDEFFPEATVRYFREIDAEVMRGGRTLIDQIDGETRRHAEGAWFMYSRFPVRGASGEILGSLGISRRLPACRHGEDLYARLCRVSGHIQQTLSEPLDVGGLAAREAVSRSQLERDFTRFFGASPLGYQRRLRMTQALTLLRGSEPVAQIAQACGYADQSAFTRRFVSEFGLTPRQVRRERLSEIGGWAGPSGLLR